MKKPRTILPGVLVHLNHFAILAALSAALVLVASPAANAGSATWLATPVSADWNTAANWTPATVPNGASDTATFASSSITNLSNSATTEVNGIVFNAGASAYSIATGSQLATFRVSGAGITNNSGITQNFAVNATSLDYGTFTFLNSATAGTLTNYTVAGGLVASGAPAALIFGNTSSAGSASIIANGGTVASANGGLVNFINFASAGTATITADGSSVADGLGGVVEFDDSATANGAVLIANGGSHRGNGGIISFTDNSTGGTARVSMSGNNATLDISQHSSTGVSIGSLDGKGLVTLGGNNLTLGGNNVTTSFSGTISDNGTSGAITKIGKGKFTLSKESTYAGGTTVKKGTLLVTNRTGSATGTGPVSIAGGTLSGTGTVSGAVVLGGALTAILAPGGGSRPGTITSLSSVTFTARATFRVDVSSSLITADQLTANGVTIDSGAQVSISDLANNTLTSGTTFTLISNTAATAISGTFASLPDGGTVTVGHNTYVANYEGGDGNDLTLTVQ